MFAGKSVLIFEPKMPVKLDVVATTATPESFRPTLGPLANLRYKPCRWSYLLRLSQAPAGGTVAVKLMAGNEEIRTETFQVEGVTEIGQDVAVNLSHVAGETPLRVEVDVTAATGAGITATLDSAVYVELPLTVSGCA